MFLTTFNFITWVKSGYVGNMSCGPLCSHTNDAIEKQHTGKGNDQTLLLQRKFLVYHLIHWKLDLVPQDLTSVFLPSNFSVRMLEPPQNTLKTFSTQHSYLNPAFLVSCCGDVIQMANAQKMTGLKCLHPIKP